jgi:predicted choloylglycine hydrolase
MWTSEVDELGLLPELTPASHAAGPDASGEVGLTFHAMREPAPGERWAQAFAAMWPAYRAWYLSQGESKRPELLTCRRMLDKWMPELVPTFERLVALAGRDPMAARFLSLYGPPGFVVGCSQAAFIGDGGPVLVRNYDYPVSRLEGILYCTEWTGRQVIGMSDCLWGLLDGINDAGLAASLTFGGRPAVGEGFGIPLVMRYVLEVCATVAEACVVLERIPVHTAQNVTLLDREGDCATVYLGPGRDVEFLNVPVATNHQRPDDWPQYARAVDTFERERRLLALIHDPEMTAARLEQAFLQPPLYRDEFASGVGTLYTSVYHPVQGRAEYRWPADGGGQSFDGRSQSFARFVEGSHPARYRGAGR